MQLKTEIIFSFKFVHLKCNSLFFNFLHEDLIPLVPPLPSPPASSFKITKRKTYLCFAMSVLRITVHKFKVSRSLFLLPNYNTNVHTPFLSSKSFCLCHRDNCLLMQGSFWKQRLLMSLQLVRFSS